MIATNTSFTLIMIIVVVGTVQGLLATSSVVFFMVAHILADLSYLNMFAFLFITMWVRSLHHTTRQDTSSGVRASSNNKSPNFVRSSASEERGTGDRDKASELAMDVHTASSHQEHEGTMAGSLRVVLARPALESSLEDCKSFTEANVPVEVRDMLRRIDSASDIGEV
jgi:hypothetical protein